MTKIEGADQRYFPGGFNLSNTWLWRLLVQLRIAKVNREHDRIRTAPMLFDKCLTILRFNNHHLRIMVLDELSPIL